MTSEMHGRLMEHTPGSAGFHLALFMNPHCGQENCRENEMLLRKFFNSCKTCLLKDECSLAIIILAKPATQRRQWKLDEAAEGAGFLLKNTLPFFEVLFSMLHSCNKLVSENIETVVGSLGGVCVNLNCLFDSKYREKPSL